MDRCLSAGVAVCRRSTGGGAVLHGQDLTYSIVAPHEGRSVMECYSSVADALIAAFAVMGVAAEVAGHEVSRPGLACFAVPSGADLQVSGRKICGSAQARRGGWFLQHGSIPLRDVRHATAKLTGFVGEDRSTCLDEVAPGLQQGAVAEALFLGMQSRYGRCHQRPAADLELNEALHSARALANPLVMV